MSSRLISTVLIAVIVGPFLYVAAADAQSIKQHLAKQNEQIQQLSTESVQLDKELDKTVETKAKAEAEVQQLEKETQDTLNERQRLEAELGAN